MKTKNFFASCAKATFALAAVVMMSTAFTSCSKDNDDDNETFTNTITINGEERPILRALCDTHEKWGEQHCRICLYPANNSNDRVEIELNKDLHITNTPIKLDQKEKEHAKDKWYWAINYFNSNSTNIISAFANPNHSKPVFKTGTLTMSGSPTGTMNIKLENGSVVGTDGNTYTLAISYSGPITKK